jgi:signal transduction histidine kinase
MNRRLTFTLAAASVALLTTAVVMELTVHAGRDDLYSVWMNLPVLQTPPASHHVLHRGGLLFAATWTLVGLIAWARRPDNRCGRLMTLAGWAALLPFLYWDEPVWFTFSRLSGAMTVGFAIHLFVVFPDGRLRSWFERVVVAAGYTDVVVSAVVWQLSWNPAEDGCEACPHNLLLSQGSPQLGAAVAPWIQPLDWFVLVSLVVILGRRWLRATRPSRRMLAPVVGMATVVLLLLVAYLVAVGVFHLPRGSVAFRSLDIAAGAAGCAVPLALLAGLLRSRLHRGAVADLVVQLDRVPALTQPRDAIARALGDPTLELGYWLPERGHYVDFDGRPMQPLTNDPERAVTLLRSDGAPLAALVYDPSLLDDRTLLDAVGSAARLALENARLHAALQARLDEVRASRARIVEASDAERRRIERNLHDGAQQRLLGIRLTLRLASTRLDDAAALQTLLDEADTEAAAAVDELRRLARGIHPAVLTEAGLPAALRDLARRCTVPVTVATADERLPAMVEAAAYFVVAEALANITKHARAGMATVDVACREGRLEVEVTDDGVGGATSAGGTGLRNLQDRVEALDGSLTIISNPGAGTRIRAVFPCA